MGMSSFMARFGGGAPAAVEKPQVPPKSGEEQAVGMASFLLKFGRDDRKLGGYTSYEDDRNTDAERADIEAFVQKWGRVTEEYKFFNDTVTIRFDKEAHKYYRVEYKPETDESIEIEIPGVTTIVGIKDKSFALMPWAANETAAYAKNKFLELTPEQMGQVIMDELHFQDWFFSVLEDARKNYKELSKFATDIGHLAHEWIEGYAKALMQGDQFDIEYHLNMMPEEPKAARCCEAAVAWIKAHNVRFVYVERKVYSIEDDCAGTLDAICLVDSCNDPDCEGCDGEYFVDILSAADWKSSNALYSYYRWQVATYRKFVNEELGQELLEKYGQMVRDYWVIKLGKDDGDFKPWRCPETDFEMDYKCFKSCLNLYNDSKFVDDTIRTRKAARRAEKKAAKEAAELAAKQAREEAREARRQEKAAERAAIDARKAARAAAKAAKEAEKNA